MRTSTTLATVVTILTPGVLSLRTMAGASEAIKDCYGKTCLSLGNEEYCSSFSEHCEKCADICGDSHNYDKSLCSRQCPEYGLEDPLKADIHAIRNQQFLILVLLIIILAVLAVRYTIKAIKWLKRKRCVTLALKKFTLKKDPNLAANNKEIGTISNMMHINEMERAPSQIYSVTGVEGSTMLTVTTPVSTRHPAEDSTTTTPTEYSYDNAALQVTPVAEKPTAAQNVF